MDHFRFPKIAEARKNVREGRYDSPKFLDDFCQMLLDRCCTHRAAQLNLRVVWPDSVTSVTDATSVSGVPAQPEVAGSVTPACLLSPIVQPDGSAPAASPGLARRGQEEP